MTIAGIDISSNNGDVDMAQVAAAGYSFCFIKSTEADGYTNPNFARDWTAAKAAGLTRGTYHFARPSVNGPQAEADYFLAALARVGGPEVGDLIALDLEDPDVAPNADLFSWTLTWLQAVEAALGFKPLLYSGQYYLQPHNCLYKPELAAYPIWLANYQSTPPPAPPVWDAIAIHQFTDHLSVPGIQGNVDGDRFFGDIAELKALGKPESAPAPVLANGDAAKGYAQLTICYDGQNGARQYFLDGESVGDLDEVVRRIEAVKERYGLAGDH